MKNLNHYFFWASHSQRSEKINRKLEPFKFLPKGVIRFYHWGRNQKCCSWSYKNIFQFQRLAKSGLIQKAKFSEGLKWPSLSNHLQPPVVNISMLNKIAKLILKLNKYCIIVLHLWWMYVFKIVREGEWQSADKIHRCYLCLSPE